MLTAGEAGELQDFRDHRHVPDDPVSSPARGIESQGHVKMGNLLKFRSRLFQHWAMAVYLLPYSVTSAVLHLIVSHLPSALRGPAAPICGA